MNKQNFIPSINFHLWQPCNMRCGFCFARFLDVKNTILPQGHLPKSKAIKTVKLLCDHGFEKITFVGGEPTLCPWLSDLIKVAKQKGLTTMIVTNGTGLSDEFLSENKEYLDWIGISMDSLNPQTNKRIGRITKGRSVDCYYYQNLVAKIKKYNYRIKVNTVVNQYNYQEDMRSFIELVKPERWKVLKVLKIEEQNGNHIEKYQISDEQFNTFINQHNGITSLVKEDNNDMMGSYVMVDPAGRFFDNTKGIHTYSSVIAKVGVEQAFSELNYCFKKFINRDGLYKWR